MREILVSVIAYGIPAVTALGAMYLAQRWPLDDERLKRISATFRR